MTPGDAKTSSAVLKIPSAPGLRDRALPTIARESDPPFVAKWQVPHATVRVEESCSSQKRVLPRYAFAAGTGFPAGAGGGSSGAGGPTVLLPVRGAWSG